MKRVIALLLALMLVLLLSAPAFALTTESDKHDIHVTVFGLDQPYVNRIWAVTDRGAVTNIVVWDTEDHSWALDGNAVLKPNHKYELVIRVTYVVGDVYINGVEDTRNWSFGDIGTQDCYATGRLYFTTPNFAPWQYCPYPCFGFGWYIPPMWGFWRCW